MRSDLVQFHFISNQEEAKVFLAHQAPRVITNSTGRTTSKSSTLQTPGSLAHHLERLTLGSSEAPLITSHALLSSHANITYPRFRPGVSSASERFSEAKKKKKKGFVEEFGALRYR